MERAAIEAGTSEAQLMEEAGLADFGRPQNAYEVTLTGKVELAEGLLFRTEYRYDWSPRDLYEDDSSRGSDVQDDQHTVAAELSYVF